MMSDNELTGHVIEAYERGAGRNQIARQIGCSRAAVDQIAKAHGLSFDRSQTAEAVKARSVDMAERRADLAYRWLDVANDALDRLDFTDPTAARNVATVAGIATTRHLDLNAVDGDKDQNARAESWINGLVDAISNNQNGESNE